MQLKSLEHMLLLRKRWCNSREYILVKFILKKDNIDCIRECVSITINKKATNQEKSDAYAMMGEIYLEQNQINRSAQMIARKVWGRCLKIRNYTIL